MFCTKKTVRFGDSFFVVKLIIRLQLYKLR